MKRNKGSGFTLVELIIVLAILGVLAAFAMPSYRNFIDRQKVRSALNEWQNSYYFAQREAMRLKNPITLCGSENGQTCRTTRSDFSLGWVVLDEATVLQTVTMDDPRLSINITGNQFPNAGIVFLSTGRIRNNATGALTVSISANSGGGAATQQSTLTINNAGRLIGVKR